MEWGGWERHSDGARAFCRVLVLFTGELMRVMAFMAAADSSVVLLMLSEGLVAYASGSFYVFIIGNFGITVATSIR